MDIHSVGVTPFTLSNGSSLLQIKGYLVIIYNLHGTWWWISMRSSNQQCTERNFSEFYQLIRIIHISYKTPCILRFYCPKTLSMRKMHYTPLWGLAGRALKLTKVCWKPLTFLTVDDPNRLRGNYLGVFHQLCRKMPGNYKIKRDRTPIAS